MTSLSINRKNTKSYTLTIKENDEPKNIDGYTIYFTVKKNSNDLSSSDLNALISKEVEATSEVGIVTVSLTTSETNINPGVYFYDIKLKNPTGTWVKSTDVDKFVVKGAITND